MKMCTKFYLIPAIALLIGVTHSDIAQSQQGVFNGMWKSIKPEDGLMMMIQDNGQQISSESYSQTFDHFIQGNHITNDQATIIVTRKNILNNCVTKMYATWSLMTPNHMRTQITGTDGRCDLPGNFQELRIFYRQ